MIQSVRETADVSFVVCFFFWRLKGGCMDKTPLILLLPYKGATLQSSMIFFAFLRGKPFSASVVRYKGYRYMYVSTFSANFYKG